MKKSALLVALMIFAACVIAQVPKAFNYQAVVRNSSGEIIANQDVSFRISILENSESGTAVYVETHTYRTNNFGLANLKIGRGTKISGTFEAENWKENSHFIQVEIDPEGGSNFSLLGTSELLSVPYAFHADTVENDAVEDADADPLNEIQALSLNGSTLSLSKNGGSVALPSGSTSPWLTNGSNIYYNSGKVGIGTETPVNLLDLNGKDGNAYLRFNTNGTGTNTNDGLLLGIYNDDKSSWLLNYENSPLKLGTNGTAYLTVSEEGKVVVGQANPNTNGILTVFGKSDNAWISFNNDATGNSLSDGLVIGQLFNNSGTYIWNLENTPMIFSTNNKQRMVIKEDGNVGIGTLSPNSNGKFTIYGGTENAWISFNNDATGNGPQDGMIIGELYNNTGVYVWNLENTPMKFATNNSVRMTLGANGYVGVGTESPSAGFHLKGTGFPSSFMYIQSDAGQDAGIRLYEGSTAKWHIFNNSALGGLQIYNNAGNTAIFAKQSNSYVGIGTTSPTQALHVVGNAYKTEGGTSWATSSDIRLKNLLGNYSKGLTEIIALQPVRYVYKKGNPRQLNSTTEQVGFVAQDVHRIFPESVSTGEDGYLDFNIHAINVAMVNAIKELNEENQQLKSKVAIMEQRLEQIEALVKASALK